MSELEDLYQEVILDHYKKPRNYGRPERSDKDAHGKNPLCGDDYEVFLCLEGGRIADVRFEGSGCAISKASASVMTEAVKGMTLEEFRRLFGTFHDLVTGKGAAGQEELGKLAVFSGVSAFPVRVKCATLPWHTLQAAIEGGDEVTTE